MDDAQLHFGLGIGDMNRLGEAAQPVDASDEEVFQSPALQIGQAGEPELGSFGFGQPAAE